MVKARFINDTKTVNVRSVGSATSHDQLIHRELPNQHPIEAITDLQNTLTNIGLDIIAEENRAESIEGNLENLTTDNKGNLVAAINEVDSHNDTNANHIANHIADKNNPHEVTKAQVGLGNVENTAPSDLPISTATQSALDLKLDSADLGNATLEIQKNGTTVGVFTANSKIDSTINLIVPTQASDVNALPDTTKYGANLSLSINSSTFVVTAQLKDQNGNNLGSAQTIDLPLESVVVNGSYDSTNKKIILTLENGNTIDIPVADLVAGLQSEITVDNMLSADLVDDSGQTNKFVTASEKSQITTNASDIATLQSGKADKSTTYTKTEVDTIASGKANVGLDNLNADGQMIIDSVNGYISNCILEIPQNLKLELSNNTLTLKAGSIVTLARENYVTYTVANDLVRANLSLTDNKKYVFFTNNIGTSFTWNKIGEIGSGSSLPADNTDYLIYFLTTDKNVYAWSSGAWVKSYRSYPICILESSGGVISFAKDSNGNDMIFNGAGYIGHHAFVYPNVKGLIPNGFNDNGTLKSTPVTINSLYITELTNTTTSYDYTVGLTPYVTQVGKLYIDKVKSLSDITVAWVRYYVEDENGYYYDNTTAIIYAGYVPLISYIYDGTSVTDFTIQQPVRLATTEMLDKVQSQVDTKQVDVTTLIGYDSTQTQTLKNINGVLQWVTD